MIIDYDHLTIDIYLTVLLTTNLFNLNPGHYLKNHMDLPQQLSPTKIQFTFQAFATRSATQNWQELLSLLYYRLLNIINQFPIPFRFTPLIMLYSLAHQRCLINFPNFFIYLYSSYYHFTNSNNCYYRPNFHTFVLYSNGSHLYYSYY